MLSSKLLVVLISLTAIVSSTESSSCSVVESAKNFDVPKFMGMWYEQERYFNIFQLGAACVRMEFETNGNESMTVNNTEVNEVTGQHSSIFGLAHFVGDANVAQISVEFPFIGSLTEPYWIIDTDYTTYAVLWTCNDLIITKTELAWILTRERFPDEELLLKVKDKLVKVGINVSRFERSDQTRCYKQK